LSLTNRRFVFTLVGPVIQYHSYLGPDVVTPVVRRPKIVSQEKVINVVTRTTESIPPTTSRRGRRGRRGRGGTRKGPQYAMPKMGSVFKWTDDVLPSVTIVQSTEASEQTADTKDTKSTLTFEILVQRTESGKCK
jgi:hypothetical protein